MNQKTDFQTQYDWVRLSTVYEDNWRSVGNEYGDDSRNCRTTEVASECNPLETIKFLELDPILSVYNL